MRINFHKSIAWGILFAFLGNSVVLPSAHAQEPYLPAPGQMVALSPTFSPAVLKGIKLDPNNPFRFHFYVDSGDDVSLRAPEGRSNLKAESSKLIKYFLASLTIPEKDLWVNLSPYEKDRIVPQEFGQTEMGRDLLAQDYMLKQITASLIYPESQLGKEFWAKVYAKAQAKYGTTQIPVNTFNKVWIIPEKAVVYENGGTAFVLENHLKVMLEEDYLSLEKHEGIQSKQAQAKDTNQIGNQIVREIVIPALTKEVNAGKNFAQLRQVFYSLILATWYKKKIKDSILNKVLSNKNKINGVNVESGDKDRIYQKYLQAFKKGAYNYIKEEPTAIPGQNIARKYFSGGVEAKYKIGEDLAMVGLSQLSQSDKAAISREKIIAVDVLVQPLGAMNAQLSNTHQFQTAQELKYYIKSLEGKGVSFSVSYKNNVFTLQESGNMKVPDARNDFPNRLEDKSQRIDGKDEGKDTSDIIAQKISELEKIVGRSWNDFIANQRLMILGIGSHGQEVRIFMENPVFSELEVMEIDLKNILNLIDLWSTYPEEQKPKIRLIRDDIQNPHQAIDQTNAIYTNGTVEYEILNTRSAWSHINDWISIGGVIFGRLDNPPDELRNVFEYHGEKKELPYGNQQIEPLDIKKEEHGVVHLHYKFQKR